MSCVLLGWHSKKDSKNTSKPGSETDTPAEIEEITHNHTHTTPVRGLAEVMLVLGRILTCMAGTGIKQTSIKEMIHTIINDMFGVNCHLPFPRIYRESVKQNLFGTSGVDADMPEVGYLSKHTAGTPYDSHIAPADPMESFDLGTLPWQHSLRKPSQERYPRGMGLTL